MQRPGFLGEETYIKKKENKRPPETPIPYLTLDKILLRLIEGIIASFFKHQKALRRIKLANFPGVGSPPPDFPDKFLFCTPPIIIRKY